MMADLHAAFADPRALIQSTFAQLARDQHPRAAEAIAARFRDLFTLESDRALIPLLTAHSSDATLPPPGSLVRFRAMVQDTGFGTEVFQTISSRTGETLLFGIEEQAQEDDSMGENDYSNLGERQAIFIVNVPGETSWARESLESADGNLSNEIANLTLSTETPSSSPLHPLFESKFPIPSATHFGCIAKIYNPATVDAIKIAGVYEFVGVMGDTSLSTPFEDMINSSASPSTTAASAPALHVLFTLPASTIPLVELPTTVEGKTTMRQELIAYLQSGLGGDIDAAEWVLLAILARIHTRHPTGISLGSLSLNLSFPTVPASSAASILSSALVSIFSNLVQNLVPLELSIPFLNDTETRFAPRNREENLESGALQLSDGTLVLVDLRRVGEGKLFDTGVKNLQTLTTTIANQKLGYQFPYSSFDLETDLNFVLISEGKSFVPTTCIVQVRPEEPTVRFVPPTKSQLDLFRSFLHTYRLSDFSIPSHMSEMIQNDFVSRRKGAKEGEAMSSDDLLFRMTAARLMCLSHGKTSLDAESWTLVSDLDERRKVRLSMLGSESSPTQMKE